jgi:hypothetical protein
VDEAVGLAGWNLERYSFTWSHVVGRRLGSRLRSQVLLRRVPERKLCPRIGTSEADRNPLPPGDFELDRGPMARRAPAIDAAAPDPFARLEIGVFVKAFDEAAGAGAIQGPRPTSIQTSDSTICIQTGNKSSTNYKNAQDFGGPSKIVSDGAFNWAMNLARE